MKRILIAALFAAATIGFALPATASDGGALYKAKCAACHGGDGQGTAMAPAFVGNDWVGSAPDADVAATIKDGRQGAAKKYKNFAIGMPAQKGMADADVAALVAHLKELAAK